MRSNSRSKSPRGDSVSSVRITQAQGQGLARRTASGLQRVACTKGKKNALFIPWLSLSPIIGRIPSASPQLERGGKGQGARAAPGRPGPTQPCPPGGPREGRPRREQGKSRPTPNSKSQREQIESAFGIENVPQNASGKSTLPHGQLAMPISGLLQVHLHHYWLPYGVSQALRLCQ
jgi:hypothetical protein